MNKYHNVDREKILLKQILDMQEDQKYYIDKLKIGMFYDKQNAHIANVIKYLDSEKKIVSISSVSDYIKLNEKDINQKVLLSSLKDVYKIETQGIVDEHMQLLEQLQQNRVIDDKIVLGVKKLQDDNASPQDIVSHIQNAVSEIILDTTEPINNTADKAFKSIEDKQKKGEDSLKTGIKEFDKSIGIKKRRYFVVAALSSVGKSFWSYDILLRLFKKNDHDKIAIKYFSLEISKEDFLFWLICNLCNITFKRLEGGGKALTPEEIARIKDAVAWIKTLPLSIEEGINTNEDIALKTQKYCIENKGKHVVVFMDHHLKVKMTTKDMRQHIIEMSANCANLKKHNDLTFFLLAQLRRDLLNEKYAETLHRPSSDFIQESGSLFQDADHVMCLWRPDMYKYKGDDPNMQLPDIHDMHMIVEKNKSGQKDFDIVVKCQPKYGQLLDGELPFETK